MRDFLLRGCVLAGVATALVTELLGAFHLLRPVPLAVAWIVIVLGAVRLFRIRAPKTGLVRGAFRTQPLEAAIALAIVWIVALVGATAKWSAPNSFDVLGYHMPRVVYWAQAHSVAFFATPYLNQIQFPPLAEYFMLHAYLLTGGDHFVNIVNWAAFAGCILGVSAIAAALGTDSRTQAFAALFCATLPSSVLQASGSNNDPMLALWLVCAVYFAARRNGLFLALSLGLAVLTKGTAYVFAPPLMGGMFLCDRQPERWNRWRFIPIWAASGILLSIRAT